MRRIGAVLLLSLACGTVAAQSDGKKPSAPRPVSKFLPFSEGSIDGVPSVQIDGVLKLTQSGNQITASGLDVCFPSDGLSLRLDRLAIPLQVQGSTLSGSGVSSGGRQVAVALKRTGQKDSLGVEGTLTLPGHTIRIAQSDLVALNEDPTASIAQPDGTGEEDPDDGASVTDPSKVLATVKIANLTDLIRTVRAEGGRLDPVGLIPQCSTLRSGRATASIEVNPSRSAALLDKVRAVPGVTNAEFGTVLDHALLIRLKAKPNEADFASILSKAAQKAIPGLSTVSSEKDPSRGEVRVAFRRTLPDFAAVGIQEAIMLRAFVWQDVRDTSKFYIRLRPLDAKLVDADPKPVLLSGRADTEGEDDSTASDLNTEAAQQAIGNALAAELHGEVWADERWVAK